MGSLCFFRAKGPSRNSNVSQSVSPQSQSVSPQKVWNQQYQHTLKCIKCIKWRASKSWYPWYPGYWGTFTESSRLRNILDNSRIALSHFKTIIDKTWWLVTYQILSLKIFIYSTISPNYSSIFHLGTLLSSIYLHFLSPAKIGGC